MNKRDMTDSELSESLRGLRETVSGVRAGPRVEEMLLREFRKSSLPAPAVQKRWWPKWALAGAAAAMLVAVVFVTMHREDTRPATVADSRAPAVKAEIPEAVVAPPERPAPRMVRQATTAGEFIPLVPDLRWEPSESGQIVRVRFPRAALQSFGLPVNENRTSEMVSADILVGQDMVARAIRVVR